MVKKIGDKIHIHSNVSNDLRIIIPAQMEKWKETLLLTWLLAWSFCGVYFLYELFAGGHDGNMRLFFIILLSFWLYYEVKIGKAFLWRKYGKELIKVDEDKLYLKSDIRSYGKMNGYFKDNIKNFGVINLSEKSFKKHAENSYWVVGGETIGFEYMGKKVGFAKQLPEKDAKKLAKLIASYIN